MEQPAQRTPAPGALALVQAFVNSVDLEEGEDELVDVGGATAWLQNLGGTQVQHLGEEDRRHLVRAREALRDVLAGHDCGPGGADAAAQLSELMDAAYLRAVVTVDGARLQPAGEGIDAFLARLGSTIVEATVGGTWSRLKVCREDSCRWAFYDHSKNGRGAWCTMRVCGNRAKARAYRERRRAAATP